MPTGEISHCNLCNLTVPLLGSAFPVQSSALKAFKREPGTVNAAIIISVYSISNRRTSMEQDVLSDAAQFPTEEIIFSHIGKTKVLWISFFEYIQKPNIRILSKNGDIIATGKAG
jgi:hypothetical protein